MKKYLLLILLILLLSATFVFGQSSFRMVSYNLLQYDGTQRNEYFKTVLDETDPDLIVVQEIVSQDAVDTFVDTVLSNRLATIPFHGDGYSNDNHIFYNPFLMEIISSTYIPTDLRDIAEFKIRFPRTDDTVYVYSAHLKAGNPDFGYENEDLQRLAEVTVLRDNHLNDHPERTKFIICGDLNLYGADEPAYQKLLADETGNFGQSFDPINRPGEWHSNSSFADIHTQSTRTLDLGDGGSTGGMDDRFDFILVSESMVEKVEEDSYMAFGNDGNHFNQAINNGGNNAVSIEVADALYYASDHLPVVADFDLSISSIESEKGLNQPTTNILHRNFPNPFNPTTAIGYRLSAVSNVELSIYNVVGEKIVTLVSEEQNPGSYEVQWDASGFASGLYLYILNVESTQFVKKMVLLR